MGNWEQKTANNGEIVCTLFFNVNALDCSTLFVLICYLLTDVARHGSSYRG